MENPERRAAELMNEFEMFRMQRLSVGAEEYGDYAFLEKETPKLFTMLYEELADGANYYMFLYSRLRLMEEELASRLDSTVQPTGQNTEHFVSSGASSFTPQSKVHGLLQDDTRVQDS